MGRDDEAETHTLTLLEGRTGACHERQLSVEVVGGPDRPLARVLPVGRAVVGSDPECDLALSDPTVSRRHVALSPVEGGVRVVDLGSKNGTRVMGALVQEALLPGVGQLELGGTTLRVSSVDRAVPAGERLERFGDYLTASVGLGAVLAQLRRAAAARATVLLEGETGTGKELLARALHAASPRARGPLVVVDCGAATAGHLEAQLFGEGERRGAFEAAAGGTIFLDALGELPLALQPQLLRALEARTVQRVGDLTPRPVDARIVAATHQALDAMVAAGTFRADLYYRVAVVRVRVPPLRERPEDVPHLAAHFAAELSGGAAELSPEAYAALAAYDWPGNARELRNVVERALALADGPRVAAEALFGVQAAPATTFHAAKDQLLLAFETRYVTELLARHHGNVSHAAKEAGLSRNALYALMRRVGLDPR
jgi:two-component system response regulator GlrR